MSHLKYLTLALTIIGLIGVVLAPRQVSAQENIDVNGYPYFQKAWTVGMHADWESVNSAEEYRILYFSRDAEGKQLTRVGVPVSNIRFDTFKNEGAPDTCAYHWIQVQAKDADGNTIAKGSDNFCKVGFWIDNETPVGLAGTKEEMQNTLDFAKQALRDMAEDLHISER